MMRCRILMCVLLIGALFVGAVPSASADDSARCSGHLVQRGDPSIKVKRYCGQPTFVDPWRGNGAAYGVSFSMEAWTYNWGPGRLIEIFVFRNGKVDSIETAGYGFRPGQVSLDCSRGGVANGMSKYQLIAACGEPAQRRGTFIYSSRFSSGAQDYYLKRGVFPVYRETWVYNFGPSRLLRQITLENGRVVSNQTLGRGFDPN